MPTPSSNPLQLSSAASIDPVSTRTTCPPENATLDSWGGSSGAATEQHAEGSIDPTGAMSPAQSESEQAQDACLETNTTTDVESFTGPHIRKEPMADDDVALGLLSPAASTPTEAKDVLAASSPSTQNYPPSIPSNANSMSYEYSNVRLFPNHTSSFLRAGSKFVGTQQSDRQIYNVDVEIKHVDMAESYLCGYLRIQGLTEDHPTLTTFFEGEIIGTKHTFQTRHESWGATDKTDMSHWARFSAWRPLSKMAKRPDFTYTNFAQRENIFMRWKEYFLVPDHRVRSISGASFEGFYYICFNQVKGTVSGIYFHAGSEKYQQLELKHVDNKGCFGAMEFR